MALVLPYKLHNTHLVERSHKLGFDAPALVLTADQSLTRRTCDSEAGADEHREPRRGSIKKLISENKNVATRSNSPTNVPND
jgi:hypothetical protein